MKAKKLLAMILSLTMILGLCTVGAKATDEGRTLTVTIELAGSTTANTVLHVEYSDGTDAVDTDLNTLFALAKGYVKDGDIINLPAGDIYFKTGSTSNEVNIFHSVTINGNADGTTLYFCGQAASNDRCIRIMQIGSSVGNGPTVTINNITLDGTNSTKQASAFYVKHSTLNMNDSTIKNFGDMNAFFLNAIDEAYNKYHSTPDAEMVVETQFDATINADNVTFSGVKNALKMEVYPSSQITKATPSPCRPPSAMSSP